MVEKICKNCETHLDRMVYNSKNHERNCSCVYPSTCLKQYLSENDKVRTCFMDCFDLIVNYQHSLRCGCCKDNFDECKRG